MKFFDRVVAWLVVNVYIKSGLMRRWSLIHAWLYERKKQAPLRRYDSIEALAKELRELKWTADTWRELWDCVSSLGYISWRIENDPKHFIGDCDEFGRYAACVVRNELLNERELEGPWGTIAASYLLTVMWRKTGGEEWEGNRKGYGGHNVCLIHYMDGTWAYMDYGMPTGHATTVDKVVKAVRDRYAQEYQPLGYAIHHPRTLKCMAATVD